MSKNIWGTDPGSPIESSRGRKIIGDYFGLHKAENASTETRPNHKHGTEAQQYAEETNRRSLNGGVSFRGFLACRKVDHVTLYIGKHPTLGLSAYVDRPTSHPDGAIEIVTVESTKPVVLARNEYFSHLLEDDIPEHLIEDFCKTHWRV